MKDLFKKIDTYLLNEEHHTDFAENPHAFSDKEKKPGKESTPYEEKVDEMYNSVMSRIHPDLVSELTYKDFSKSDPTKNDRQIINAKIKEVNTDLIAIERALAHCLKLKKSSSQNIFYWKATIDKFFKIENKLKSISKKIRQMK